MPEHKTNVECWKCGAEGILMLYREGRKKKDRFWYGNLCESCGYRNIDTTDRFRDKQKEKKEALAAQITEFEQVDWAVNLHLNRKHCHTCPLYCTAQTLDKCHTCHDGLFRGYLKAHLQQEKQEQRYEEFISEITKLRNGEQV